MHLEEYLQDEYPDEEIFQYMKHFATCGYTASADSQEASERTFQRQQKSVRAAVAGHAPPRTETRGGHGEPNPGEDLIDDPDGYAQYDLDVRYLTQDRSRIGDAELVRESLPTTYLWPYDVDPSQWHDLFLNWINQHKESHNPRKHSIEWKHPGM